MTGAAPAVAGGATLGLEGGAVASGVPPATDSGGAAVVSRAPVKYEDGVRPKAPLPVPPSLQRAQPPQPAQPAREAHAANAAQPPAPTQLQPQPQSQVVAVVEPALRRDLAAAPAPPLSLPALQQQGLPPPPSMPALQQQGLPPPPSLPALQQQRLPPPPPPLPGPAHTSQTTAHLNFNPAAQLGAAPPVTYAPPYHKSAEPPAKWMRVEPSGIPPRGQGPGPLRAPGPPLPVWPAHLLPPPPSRGPPPAPH
jgi:hypothetical protein